MIEYPWVAWDYLIHQTSAPPNGMIFANLPTDWFAGGAAVTNFNLPIAVGTYDLTVHVDSDANLYVNSGDYLFFIQDVDVDGTGTDITSHLSAAIPETISQRWISVRDGVRYSRDEGQNWVLASSDPTEWLYDIATDGSGRWVTVGQYGYVGYSTDGGHSWTAGTSGMSDGLSVSPSMASIAGWSSGDMERQSTPPTEVIPGRPVQRIGQIL